MTDSLEKISAHRHVIAATVPLLEAIRSLAEMAYRRAGSLSDPVNRYAERLTPLVAATIAALQRDEQRALLEASAGRAPTAVLVIGAERGLCGAFNERLVRAALSYVDDCRGRGQQVLLFCWGTRCRQLLERAGLQIAHAAALPSFVLPLYSDVEAMALQLLGDQEVAGSVPVVVVHNAPVQRWQYEVTVRRLYPPSIEPPQPRHGTTGATEIKPADDAPALAVHLLTEHLLLGLYRAVVESVMSEQLARIATMRLAVENANRLLDQLTLDYNLARQYSETNALLEIITGYEAAAGAAPLPA